jgi:hypothetical protein
MGDAPGSFYARAGDGRFHSTVATQGPWDAGAQHAGPPAALLGHAIEHRDGARADMRVARIAFTIAKPVPIATLEVSTRLLRGGRSTEIVEATLAAVDEHGIAGPPIMRAEAVLIRVADGAAPAHHVASSVPAPDDIPSTLTPFRFDVGYHTSMETRYAIGSFEELGPATVWFRMSCPLIDGEPIDPLSRVLTAADSGNGVSHVLDLRQHVFVNPELTVHLYRYPVTDWVCLDAIAMIDEGGIGIADTALHDIDGPIGRGSQSLYVASRTHQV